MTLAERAKDLLQVRPARQAINRRMGEVAAQVVQAAPETQEGKTILAFNASTRITGLSLNAAFALLTGWSLRLQGVRVVNVVCQRGMAQCVLGTRTEDVLREPPCKQCLKQSDAIYAQSEVVGLGYQPDAGLAAQVNALSLAALQGFSYEGIPLGALCLPSMRWILRRHHLVDDEPTAILYRNYILSAYSIAQQFDRLIREVAPLAVMVFNGMQFPEATARWVAQQQGIPVYSHEVGIAPTSAFFTPGEATAYPVEIPADFQLTPEMDQKLDGYLSKRFKGDFSMAGVQFWPEMSGLDQAFVERLGAFEQVVPVFTNVIFDTSQPHANVVFEDMFLWLDEVLKVAEQHPETLFVIRAHPDESRPGKASRESVADWAARNRVADRANVDFIPPEAYFSSYEMIQRSKFVMIYNSTIGLEAAIMGAPVLSAGKARFTQLETVYFPKTRKAYLAQLEDFLNADAVQPRPVHSVNARRFLYYQLYRTSLPFDEYLEPDGIWPGFVRLKEFDAQDLLPAHSETLKVISKGLLEGEPFLLAEA
jgi:hypothetical protein